jgi:hypothetical protein
MQRIAHTNSGCLFNHLSIYPSKKKSGDHADSRNLVIWNAVAPSNYFARARVKKRVFTLYCRRFRVVRLFDFRPRARRVGGKS